MAECQVVRQWKIIRALQVRQHGLTVAELAEMTEQSKRTTYRDLSNLMTSGFPIYSFKEDGHSKWKHVEGLKSDPLMPLTPVELLSLHMAREVLKVYKDAVFYDGVEAVLDKIEKIIPPTSINYLDKTEETVKTEFTGSKNYGPVKESIATVLTASLDKKRIRITYVAVSTNDETSRVVDPYEVVAKNHDLYLFGYCHLRKALRTFAVDRIKSVELLEETFEKESGSIIVGQEDQSFRVMLGPPETVRIKLSSSVSYTVRERKWHHTQHIRNLKNGSVIVSFQIPINYEIISWILSYGSKALVIEPASLRVRIVQEAKAMLKRCSGKRVCRQKK